MIIFILIQPLFAHSEHNPFDEIKIELKKGIEEINKEIEIKKTNLYLELDKNTSSFENGIISRLDYLENSYNLKKEIESIEILTDLEITRLRYTKGIELIKMIYEKILGLDHHFTSLRTFQNISDLTNPNSFPEFIKARDKITKQLDEKKTPALPKIFESNPFVSLTVSLASSLFGGGDKNEKENNLEEISCILDFSVKMHADLNIIYYETEFLKESNLTLKEDATKLFKDYTQIIEYHTSLSECRENDDWDSLFDKLDNTIEYLRKDLKTESEYKKMKIIKSINNLEFSIDRLLNFMDRYIDFIVEGEQYYTKFEIILNNYKNESECISSIPHQYSDLKRDVKNSIMKFTEAYSISEIKGSKLRDLLYGIPQ